jgi:jumonji domain-containing protein 7
VPTDISWARIALEQNADAINFWLGNERSVTAMHRDNYENVYVQVVGQKHFVLLPPIEQPCVNELELAQYRYAPSPHPHSQNPSITTHGDKDKDLPLEIQPQPETDAIPVAVWDPEAPERHRTPYSQFSRPLRVTLEAGDMLYLPAQWYHKVSQSSGPEGFACAVNYWYDMSFEGSFWVGNAFVRDVAAREARRVRYPDLEWRAEEDCVRKE